MKIEDLLTKYPSIMGDLAYVGVEEGWCDLLDGLCHVLEQHRKHKGVEIKAVQVKEKFGGLRFYVTGADDYARGAIAVAESMSYGICEVCGKPGKCNESGWHRTLCEEHRKPLEDETKG